MLSSSSLWPPVSHSQPSSDPVLSRLKLVLFGPVSVLGVDAGVPLPVQPPTGFFWIHLVSGWPIPLGCHASCNSPDTRLSCPERPRSKGYQGEKPQPLCASLETLSYLRHDSVDTQAPGFPSTGLAWSAPLPSLLTTSPAGFLMDLPAFLVCLLRIPGKSICFVLL